MPLVYDPNQIHNANLLGGVGCSQDFFNQKVDRHHPLTRGIGGFFVAPVGNFRWRELVRSITGKHFTTRPVITYRPSWDNVGMRPFLNATGNADYSWAPILGSATPVNGTGQTTLMVEFYTTVSSTATKIIISLGSSSDYDTGGSSRIHMSVSDGVTTNTLCGWVDGSTTDGTCQSAASAVAINTTYVAWLQWDYGTMTYPRLWLNGVEQSTTQVAVSAPNNSVLTEMLIANNLGGQELEGGVSWGGMWRRLLSAQEMWAMSRNPYQILTTN